MSEAVCALCDQQYGVCTCRPRLERQWKARADPPGVELVIDVDETGTLVFGEIGGKSAHAYLGRVGDVKLVDAYNDLLDDLRVPLELFRQRFYRRYRRTARVDGRGPAKDQPPGKRARRDRATRGLP